MYKLILTIRYLLKRRITHFAVAAVALCVFIVVVVMTVMIGLVQDFKQNNHAFFGDCTIGTESLVGFPYYEELMEALEQTDFVHAVSPVVKNYALLSPDGEVQIDVEILGIDPVRHSHTTNWDETLHYRDDEVERAFVPSYEPNAPGCVFGIDLLLRRDAQNGYRFGPQPPRVAVTLTCFPLTAKGAPARAATSLVSAQRFLCSDHSHSRIARIDSSYIYLPLEQAQLLCMEGEEKRVSAVYIRLRPGVGVEQGCAKIADLWGRFKQAKADAPNSFLLDTVSVQSWKAYRRAAIAPMEKEQVLLSLMFVLVGVTTVFIVFVVFYMIVGNKRKDIGVLKSVGASSVSVLSLFSGFAFCVGLVGSCTGVLLGWLFLAKINDLEQWFHEHFDIQLWDRTIYAIGDIPNHVEPEVILVVILGAIVSCLIGALVPSYLAARLTPVETLHAMRT